MRRQGERPIRILIAPDKFKGSFDAATVAAAIADGIAAVASDFEIEVTICPIADGGEGTAEALLGAHGGRRVEAVASDPIGRPLLCSYAMLDLEPMTAVVEVAEASGLWRLAPDEYDPVGADTRGTGQLIAAALSAGARRVLVACGGSATVDGGVGAVAEFDFAAEGAELICLCDTRAAFLDAVELFAPQKGAGPAELVVLRERFGALVEGWPRDPSRLPFSGAAGGLAGGLWALRGATLRGGAATVLDAVGFDFALARSDLVVTGEGRLDSSSLSGKAVGEVAARARRAEVRCVAIVAQNRLAAASARAAGIASVREASNEAAIRAAAHDLIDLLAWSA